MATTKTKKEIASLLGIDEKETPDGDLIINGIAIKVEAKAVEEIEK